MSEVQHRNVREDESEKIQDAHELKEEPITKAIKENNGQTTGDAIKEFCKWLCICLTMAISCSVICTVFVLCVAYKK